MRVGIFDSGLGGLTVLSALTEAVSAVEFFYLGDTARVPYGIRSGETVRRYAEECSRFLIEFDIDLLVVACNTASARASEYLRRVFPDLEIYDVVKPAVRKAVESNPSKVGVIGTPSTIGSGIYERELKRIRPNLKVLQKATPLLVPLVEEGLLQGKITREVLKHYLEPWKGKIDTLLLGCTHYPLLKEAILELYPEWRIIDSARPLAEELSKKLKGKEKKDNQIRLYFTDRTAHLEAMISKIPLHGKVQEVEIVKLIGTS